MLWQGQVLWGMMVYDSLRAVDWLVTRADVDAPRLATLGISMGSTMAWWLAALDERVKVTVDICCLTDFKTLLAKKNLSAHGVYYYVPRLLKHFTTAQINALIAPRAHLGLAGLKDTLTPVEGLDLIDGELQNGLRRAGTPRAMEAAAVRRRAPGDGRGACRDCGVPAALSLTCRCARMCATRTLGGNVMKSVVVTGCLLALGLTPMRAQAQAGQPCQHVPTHTALRAALVAAQGQANGGLGFHMWATIVDRDGIVCVVAFTGADRGDQWPGSRVISAQKANTANAFSLPKFALSTANLFSAVQPGGSLFGLQESNPVDTGVAYGGSPALYGQTERPDAGQAHRRRQRVRRWLGALHGRGTARGRPRCQRRHVVRRSHHRVEGPARAQSR